MIWCFNLTGVEKRVQIVILGIVEAGILKETQESGLAQGRLVHLFHAVSVIEPRFLLDS